MVERAALDPTDASHDDNWLGGYYELSIRLGACDDSRLDASLKALWRAAGLGTAFRHSPAGRAGERATVSAASLLEGDLRSVVTIPGLGSAVCRIIVVREVHLEPGEAPEADWLDLGLPMGALANLDPRVGGYPFGDTAASRGWREPIEQWLHDVARAVFLRVPFDYAVTGFEVFGCEASEAHRGWVGLLQATKEGGLNSETVVNW